jgi:predicted nucleic acid-binding protein
MSYLVDTDVCSAYLRNHPVVVSRLLLHYGALNLSVVTVGELLTWAYRANAPADRLAGIQDLLRGASVIDVTFPVVQKFGEIRAALLDRGITVGEVDLLNAATALISGLTMVTHNKKDYSEIPGLTIIDWLVP